MEKLTKQETVEALKRLFDYDAHMNDKEVIVSEHDGTTTFMVATRYMERFDVIDRLQEFFTGKVVNEGQVRLESVTFVYTVFHVEDRGAK